MREFMEYVFRIERVALACYVAIGSGESVHRNRRYHGLVFFDGPRRFTFSDGRVIFVKRNDFLYLPKGCSYVVDLAFDGGCYAINFLLAEDTLAVEPFVFPVRHAEKLRESFKAAESTWKARRLGSYEKCAQLLYSILYDLKQEMNAEYMPKSRIARIEPALSYINEHYTFENISISHLASLCGISEVYLRRIFNSAFGMSPLAYINGLKLARARELVRSGEYSVTEAATLSGFFDDSYFSREFRKAYGVSPKELLPKRSEEGKD